MVNNELGELRRSAVVMTFAPGAVVDFRAEKAAVSAVVAGLEEWDRSFAPPGLANPQVVYEPRLQRKLGVAGFRLPPVVWDSGNSDSEDNRALVAARFPTWMQCPECDTLAQAQDWANEPGHAYRYCAVCTEARPGRRRVMVIPVRFVVACSAGHLDEFPWHRWIQHKDDCPRLQQANAKLRLKSVRAGLGGLILSCPSCGQERSMEGIFRSGALRGLMRCRGHRPWLSVQMDPQGCTAAAGEPPRELRVLQRGASNLYFPVTDSALSIPPWADELQQTLGMYWGPIQNATTPADRRAMVLMLAGTVLAEALRYLQITAEKLADLIDERINNINAIEGEDLRLEEYRRLNAGVDAIQAGQKEFEIRASEVPAAAADHIQTLASVTRLREVRALKGFTRIYPIDSGSSVMAPLASVDVSWLPAIEVRGEGIFLSVREGALQEWESKRNVVERIRGLHDRYAAVWRARYPNRPPPLEVTPRFVMLHTLAHALMRELTLECGYSTASLRERLYVREDAMNMAGVLIYTATTDADGTLGGLARQGTPGRFERVLVNAIEAQRWCASDPLCIQGEVGAEGSFSIAACHACCLAPETSCEHYNRFLDRALLVGDPDHPDLGFFHQLR